MRIYTVDCYSCKGTMEYDLDLIEEESLKHGRGKIKENPDDPQPYYARCPDCGHFNRVKH